MVSLVSAEDYVVYRLLPAIQRLSEQAPVRERWLSRLHLLALAAALSAAALGVVQVRLWVPLSIALLFAAERASALGHHAARLQGASDCLGRLRGVRLWWQGLSLQEQRWPASKRRLVEDTEDALEHEVGAWTMGVLRRTPSRVQPDET